mmetsp:Transcript_47287/g.75532  ORF Transcript_47287/g.75532 Transcript_47287/m.75532 type:complete len:119 (-) Transcript_47287:840-1196(-)
MILESCERDTARNAMKEITLVTKLFQPSHVHAVISTAQFKICLKYDEGLMSTRIGSRSVRLCCESDGFARSSIRVGYWGSNGLFKDEEAGRARIIMKAVHATAVNAVNARAPKDAPES